MTTETSFVDTTFIIAIREQVSSCLADEVVILSLKSNTYHGLNSVGAFVWQFIQDESKTVKSIKNAILEEYEVDEDTCHQDLQDLLMELQSKQLIEICNSRDE